MRIIEYMEGCRISEHAFEFISRQEGFRHHMYQCPAQLGTDEWTIGYGTVIDKDTPFFDIFKEHGIERERAAKKCLTRIHDDLEFITLNGFKQNATMDQYAGWLSFTYNLGRGIVKFKCFKHWLRGDMEQCKVEFLDACHATVNGRKVVMPGLLARREREWKLIEGGDE